MVDGGWWMGLIVSSGIWRKVIEQQFQIQNILPIIYLIIDLC
jgi:hypothetical protein